MLNNERTTPWQKPDSKPKPPPTSRNDVARDIRMIGDLQRDMLREEAAMNDAIAAITAQHQPTVDAPRPASNACSKACTAGAKPTAPS